MMYFGKRKLQSYLTSTTINGARSEAFQVEQPIKIHDPNQEKNSFLFFDRFPTERRCVYPHQFNDQSMEWNCMESVDSIEKLTTGKSIPKYLNIVTYNVWFAPHMMKERMEGMMNILMERDELPDVICFQEVTDESLEMVASDPKIRKEYYLSDSPNDFYTTVDPYGVLMAVRKELPVRRIFYNTLPSRMYRASLSVELNDGKESFCVSTVHLESLASTDMRFKQLDVISGFQKSYDNAILCGDFNFDSERNYDKDYLPYLENDYLSNDSWKIYTDIWKELKYPSNELGKTFDTSVNTMLKGQTEELMRYDRIMIKSKCWKPINVELLGTTPIRVNPDVFPSDHFGIWSKIERNEQ